MKNTIQIMSETAELLRSMPRKSPQVRQAIDALEEGAAKHGTIGLSKWRESCMDFRYDENDLLNLHLKFKNDADALGMIDELRGLYSEARSYDSNVSQWEAAKTAWREELERLRKEVFAALPDGNEENSIENGFDDLLQRMAAD